MERFAKYLAEEETYTFDEPIQFESKKEDLAFSARIGFGVDERIPIERLLLFSSMVVSGMGTTHVNITDSQNPMLISGNPR